ncbi:MAG: response regulator [Alphaproteobacteria bacterium]|nr:response regulator [Alphaproteobacteria bacterium]
MCFCAPACWGKVRLPVPPPNIELSRITLASFITASPIAMVCVDEQEHIRFANAAFHYLTRNQLRDAGVLHFTDLLVEHRRADAAASLKRLREGARLSMPIPLDLLLPNGATITVSLYASRVEYQGAPTLVLQLIDTTEQKNLEIKFAHSQKMQAVGQLAGGVAHDFNNLLTAMIGFCDLLLMRHPAGDQSFADIMQIKQNANRAANLVRQLLAFSRRQTLQPKLLNATDVLAELSNLVRRLIGENIELKMVHGRNLGMVKADQGQLEQVIINLAVNGRDAMKNGGILTIRTAAAMLGPDNPLPSGLIAPAEEDYAMPAGEYVLMEISDTGTGIPRAIIQKIFEPFFSTKEVGSGTGLGLSTVYGIIKQTGGYIFVSSRENEGTTFSIYFPAFQPQEEAPVETAESADRGNAVDLTGRNTILLVEDETPVRIFAARALRNKGYTVLEADCAETALEIMERQGGSVEVIVTDVIMPGMNGPTMVEKIYENYPEMKVIFISGYAEDIFVNSYGTERSFHFLAKPFTLKQLASKVKEVAQGK